MKLRRKKEERTGAYPDLPNINPWLISINSMSRVPTHQEQIGFATNQLHYANRHFDPARDVGELFLTNTTYHPQRTEWGASFQEYFTSYLGPVIGLSGSESINAKAKISLPEPSGLDMELSAILNQRRSIRRFSGDFIGIEDLATIFHAAAGITHKSIGTPTDGGPNYQLRCRSVPSAGGLYAVDCYCFALRVRRLAVGAYKYLPYHHSLGKLSPEPSAEQMLDSLTATKFIGLDPAKIAAVLVFVGYPQKVTRKYGARGVRYLLLEAGMIAMVTNLATTALGYGVLDYQSFLDERAQGALGLSGHSHHILHMQLLGWPVASGGGGQARHD